MMFSRLAEKLLRQRLKNSPTVQQSVEEAASNHLGKASKIETAVDAVFAHDLRELAKAERDRVAAYAATKVPGLAALAPGGKGKKMTGDFIVCDDYRKGTGTVPAIIMGIVASAAIGLAGYALWGGGGEKQPPPPAIDASQYEAVLEVE